MIIIAVMFGVGIQENGIGLDPGGFNPYNLGGGYDIWDALQDANRPSPPPSGDAVDIFVAPTPTAVPNVYAPRTPLPKGYTGRLRKIWMLEYTDRDHWT